jgi:hypothetical protein
MKFFIMELSLLHVSSSYFDPNASLSYAARFTKKNVESVSSLEAERPSFIPM